MTKALDFDSLTLGESAFIEDYAGQSLESFGNKDKPKMKMLTALVTVAQRRNGNPKYSVLEASRLTAAEANAVIRGDEDDEADDEATAALGE